MYYFILRQGLALLPRLATHFDIPKKKKKRERNFDLPASASQVARITGRQRLFTF